MNVPTQVKPLNGEVMDTLVRASEMEWKQTSEKSFVKILYTGKESGSWTVLYRWLKGYRAKPHKHLGGSHTFLISGKLRVRDSVLKAGDYVYEANGMIHDETEALEDTDYIFVCTGPIVYFEDGRISGLKTWEDVEKLRH